MPNFSFLVAEWPNIYGEANRAESYLYTDPRSACFYARRTLELLVRWLYKADAGLRLPYQENLSALIHEPTFKQTAGESIFTKALLINRIGNRAVHDHRPVSESDAVAALKELFHVCYWFAHTYARGDRPGATLTFILPPVAPQTSTPRTLEKLKQLEASLSAQDEKLIEVLVDGANLDQELIRLRAEIAHAKKEAAAEPDAHDYSEAETRDRFIDLLLYEAGWRLDQARDREFEVHGMPNNHGVGYVDYVLWGNEGKPLGLVEAKRTRKDPRKGQRQAELYADCLEKEFGQRPVIFYTNGYEHWLWDDAMYPPRSVQGFYTKDELELLILRRASRTSLAAATINAAIVERHYQIRAVRRIGAAFEDDLERKALLVMATGAGKTRTVIALADLLIRCNWVKRVLFLADRVALVNQTTGAFKRYLPSASPVNLVTERDEQGRVYISTYPTMMGLINELHDGRRRFSPGHFDLIVIDEAHRSVYQKYRAIFEYFDSLLVGLTATPKDEIDKNTYSLFDLESGVPTDAYDLSEAIADGFLVPPEAVSVPLKFPSEGITYDELPSNEKELWDVVEWDEEGTVPDRVEAAALNSWLFNEDSVDKVLAHLMTHGIHVAGGDRIGKTIIFAKNQAHAEYIVERFDANYPRYRGRFARTIHHGVSYAQSLIDDFARPDKPPHIVASVDMLDTGIDVPEIVNLVFFKQVRSRTKFWQMLGRGTRLRPDLFGPGRDKTSFYILDYCGNLEFFNEHPATTGGRLVDSLSKKLFTTRLELIGEIDRQTEYGSDPPVEVREETAVLLQHEVASMDTNNFVVRPKREYVERYAEPQSWTELDRTDLHDLATEVAGLPSETEAEEEEAKRFDLLMLNLQLAVLRIDPGFTKWRGVVMEIARLLEEQAAIPMVRDQLELIEELQSEEWWQDVTVPMLEAARKKVRALVRFIEKRKRKILYTDFGDQIGEETAVDLLGIKPAESMERFRAKVQAFLKEHEDNIAIHRLRTNKPLTASDLEQLEVMLLSSGVADSEHIEQAKEESQGLGLFVRSLIGMDRGAAKEAFAGFLEGTTLNTNQIEFVNLIIDHLTHQGVMTASRLYETPFTYLASAGPEGIFLSPEVDNLIAILDNIRETAIAG